MVLLMQLEHYTATVLQSWDAKYSACRRHVRRAIAAAEAPGGSTADLIWTPSQIVLLDVDEDAVLRVCRKHTAVPDLSASALLSPHHPRGGSPRRLRLGYLSYSFGLGVRNGLMYNVFEAHDRARVEVISPILAFLLFQLRMCSSNYSYAPPSLLALWPCRQCGHCNVVRTRPPASKSASLPASLTSCMSTSTPVWDSVSEFLARLRVREVKRSLASPSARTTKMPTQRWPNALEND